MIKAKVISQNCLAGILDFIDSRSENDPKRKVCSQLLRPGARLSKHGLARAKEILFGFEDGKDDSLRTAHLYAVMNLLKVGGCKVVDFAESPYCRRTFLSLSKNDVKDVLIVLLDAYRPKGYEKFICNFFRLKFDNFLPRDKDVLKMKMRLIAKVLDGQKNVQKLSKPLEGFLKELKVLNGASQFEDEMVKRLFEQFSCEEREGYLKTITRIAIKLKGSGNKWVLHTLSLESLIKWENTVEDMEALSDGHANRSQECKEENEKLSDFEEALVERIQGLLLLDISAWLKDFGNHSKKEKIKENVGKLGIEDVIELQNKAIKEHKDNNLKILSLFSEISDDLRKNILGDAEFIHGCNVYLRGNDTKKKQDVLCLFNVISQGETLTPMDISNRLFLLNNYDEIRTVLKGCAEQEINIGLAVQAKIMQERLNLKRDRDDDELLDKIIDGLLSKEGKLCK